MPRSLEPPSARQIWSGYFGAVLPGGAGLSMLPLLVSAAMTSRNLDEAQVGLALACELAVHAGLLIWLSTRMSAVNPRNLGVFGLLLVVVGNGLCIVGDSYAGLVAGFLLRGAGLACATSAGGAFAAQLKSPQRMVGTLSLVVVAFAVLNPMVAGQLAEIWGPVAPFAVHGVMALLALGFLSGGPKSAAPSSARRLSRWAAMMAALRHPFIWTAMLAFIGMSAVWPFFSRFTAQYGLGSGATGQLIAAITLGCGMLSATSALLKDRWVAPAACGAVLVIGAGAALVALSQSLPMLIAAAALTWLGVTLAMNLLVVVAVRLDATGGLNAAFTGWALLSGALVPALAGVLITRFGSVQPLALLAGVATLGAFLSLRRATSGAAWDAKGAAAEASA